MSGSHGSDTPLFAAAGVRIAKTDHAAWQSIIRHDHNEVCLNVITAGVYVEVAEDWTTVAIPGQAVFKPAGANHGNVFGPHAATSIRVEANLDTVLGREVVAGILAMDAAALIGWASRVRDRTVACQREPVRLLATLAEAGAAHGPPEVRALSLLRRPETSSIAGIATELRTERTALAHRFRRRFGCSMRQYWVRMRVARAAELVSRGSRTMSQAAFETGFNDQSHCSRAFRGVLGEPPGRWAERVARI